MDMTSLAHLEAQRFIISKNSYRLAKAAAFSFGTINPATPSVTISLMLPPSVEITGNLYIAWLRD